MMKQKKGNFSAVIVLAGLTLIFFGMHRFPAVAPGVGEKLASYVVYPFLKFDAAVIAPISRAATGCKYLFSLKNMYMQLVAEHEALQAELIALKATTVFAQETTEIREFAQQYEEQNALLVRVLVNSCSNEGHFLLIDQGQKKGVTKDTAVVYKNCLVGKIIEVYPYMSKVVLITDPTCKVAAYCDLTKTQGIYQGSDSAGDGVLNHVGHLSELIEGDMVFSSGEGLVFPKGFAIGTIRAFSKNEGDMQYTIKVKPLIDVTTLTYCYILQKNREVSLS